MLEFFRKLEWGGQNAAEWFAGLCPSGSPHVSRAAFMGASAGLHDDANNLGDVFAWLDLGSDGIVTLDDFDTRVAHPLFVEQFTSLVDTTSFASEIAKQIPRSRRTGDALDCLIHLSDEDIAAHCRAAVPAMISAIQSLRDDLQRMKEPAPPTGVQKFSLAAGPESCPEFLFGNLDMFKAGLDRLIGLPDVNFEDAMRQEHNDEELFTTSNYDIKTFPKQEFEFVRDMKSLNYPLAAGRQMRDVAHILQLPHCKRAGLRLAEVVALVLYTGPMFMLYNKELRTVLFPIAQASLEGQDLTSETGHLNFRTTIHMIVSGVIKLSSVTNLEAGDIVYRGLGNRLLPKQFYTKDTCGCRGGVELGFMSTTRNRDMALSYASGRWPTIFRMRMGQVDRGADLSFLSQYEHEAEVLLPPLTNLEVIGDPETIVQAGQTVVVVNLRLNVNLKSLTLEEHQGRRRLDYEGTAINLLREIQLELENEVRSPEAATKEQHLSPQEKGDTQKLASHLRSFCWKVTRSFCNRPSHWFNSNSNMQTCLGTVLDLKRFAISLFKRYLREKHLAEYYMQYTLIMWRRSELGDARSMYEAAKKGGNDEQLRQTALQLVTLQQLVDADSLNEAHTMDGDTALIVAAAEGLDQRVELLIHAQCQVNYPNSEQCTPLHAAVLGGHRETVRTLLRSKANIEVGKIDDGGTPLITAAAFGRMDCMEELRVAGCQLTATTPDGAQAIHLASFNGHVGAVRKLLEWGVPVSVPDNRGFQCLHRAALNGHYSLACCLVNEFKANIQELCNEKGTALHCAASEGHVDVLTFLLQRVTIEDTDIKCDRDGYHPLHTAAMYGRADCVKILLRKCDARTKTNDQNRDEVVHVAARYGQTGFLDRLIDAGVDISAKNSFGLCPVHLACEYGNFEFVTTLRVLDVDFRARADNGQEPIHCAAGSGRCELVEFLLSRKADPNAKDSRLQTPMHMAARSGHVDVVSMLATAGDARSVHSTRDDGQGAMHLAARYGHAKVITMLRRDYDVDIAARDQHGYCPLLWAVRSGQIEAIRALLDLNADIRSADSEAQEPIHCAAGSGRCELVEFLLSRKADPNAKDSRLQTPMHMAARSGHVDVVSMLATAGDARSVHSTRDDGQGAMHLAARYGHAKVITMLRRDYDVDIAARDQHGYCPLLWAAESGQIEAIRALLDLEADPNSTNLHGETAIHRVSVTRPTDSLEILVLLAHHGADVNAKDCWNNAPIHIISKHGWIPIARALLKDLGANVEIVGKEGRRAVHDAARYGQADMIEMLVREFCADVNVADNESNYPIHFAAAGNVTSNCYQKLLDLGANDELKNRAGQAAKDLHDKVDRAASNRQLSGSMSPAAATSSFNRQLSGSMSPAAATSRRMFQTPESKQSTANLEPMPLGAQGVGRVVIPKTLKSNLQDHHR